MVQSLLSREDTSYKGYTLDGFPCLSNDLKPVPLFDIVEKSGSMSDAGPRTSVSGKQRSLTANNNVSISTSPIGSRPISKEGKTALVSGGDEFVAQDQADTLKTEDDSTDQQGSEPTNSNIFPNIASLGMPIVNNPEDQTQDTESAPQIMVLPDIKMVHSLLAKHDPMHVPVLVHLRISDENLIRRRAGQWIDPVTGQGYPTQQVLYSRRRRNEGYVDGTPDTEALIEAGMDPKPNSAGEEGGSGQNDNPNQSTEEGQDKGGDDEDRANGDVVDPEDPSVIEAALNDPNRFKRKHLKPLSIKNKQTWPILEVAVLDRLVKNPFDEPLNVAEDLKRFEEQEKAIEEISAKYFDILRVIDLDANLHPELLYEQVKMRLEMRGFSVFNKPVDVKRLPPPEMGIQGILYRTSHRHTIGDMNEYDPYRDVGYGTNQVLSRTQYGRK